MIHISIHSDAKWFIDFAKKHPLDARAANTALDAVYSLEKEDYSAAHELIKHVRRIAAYGAKNSTDINIASDFRDIQGKTFLFDAYDSFDAYLIYLEWDRRPSERFYMPRRKTLKRVVDQIQRLVDDDLDELFISLPARVGKLLADDTPILTTNGWTTHGQLRVGDFVYNPDGEAVEVVYIHPKQHTTHTVRMSDGSMFECHFRHEWKVYNRLKGKEEIIETHKMIDSIKSKEGNHYRRNYLIPLKNPIAGEHKNLPVHPYVLGAWLGDGTTKTPRITVHTKDNAIIEKIVECGYEIGNQYDSVGNAIQTNFIGLRDDLKNINMCHSRIEKEKHIPDIYFTSSKEQRLQLLAGLLDTDGTLSKKEKRYMFSTGSERLMNDVKSLIETFGWRTSVSKYEPKTSTSGIVGKKPYYQIGFNPTEHIPCVLERKKLYEFSKQKRIGIDSIVESEQKQGNCITVDGGMYLAGRSLTPTHNTTLLMMLMTWIIGRDPEASNLYCAFSDNITKAFYTGVLEIIEDQYTYKWKDVFPKAYRNGGSAQEETINIGRKKRYASLTCRSLYGTLNGSCDCNGICISDDLLSGIEEAVSKDRLDSAWDKVDNNLIPRMKEGAKGIWCGTRWASTDPIANRIDLIKSSPKYEKWRYKVINIPALDKNNESNFVYDYGVGFSTEHYQMRHASFERKNDLASWFAQYQGTPIDRIGTLFDPNSFDTFNGELPNNVTPDRIFMAIDPSWGGGDYVAGPVCFDYRSSGGKILVMDVIYTDMGKDISRPLIIGKIKKYGVQAVLFEANKMTADYADWIDDKLKSEGIRINITHRPAGTKKSKENRIQDKASDVRELFSFLEPRKRSAEYTAFMDNIYAFKKEGGNKHDDAPDSMAMAVDMANGLSAPTVMVAPRPKWL